MDAADFCFDFTRLASSPSAASPGSGCPCLVRSRSNASIMMGNTPMPSTWRMSCMMVTSGAFAPMAAATMGVSLIPPGTAHMSDVTRLRGDVAHMRNPTTRFSRRKIASRSTIGFRKPRSRTRSLRSSEHPTNAPATICTSVRVSVGSKASPVAMLSTDTPKKAPIMNPAGTLSLFAMSPQGMPTAMVNAAHMIRCSSTYAPVC